MASNNQSTQPARHLAPSRSIAKGASIFITGEYVLVRIPERIEVDGHLDDEATVAGADLPPTSNGQSPQHFAFIRQLSPQPGGYLLEVYPVLFFTSSGGALAGYNELNDAAKATLLPLPPLSLSHPTPEAFGARLEFENWSTSRDSWLLTTPMRFLMPLSRAFKRMDPTLIISPLVLDRIDRYRAHLRSNMQATDTGHRGDQTDPPPDGGSRAEQDGGQTAPGQTSVISSPIITNNGGGEKAGGAGQEQFSVNATHSDVLVLEGVDDGADGANATMLDELRLLAQDGDPIWMEELRKYLQKEERERAQLQKERAVRLAHWREGITMAI